MITGMTIRRKAAALAAITVTAATIGVATASSAAANPGNSCSPGVDLMNSGDNCYYMKGEYWVQGGGYYRICSGDHYGWIDTMDFGFINFGAWQCFNLPSYNTYIYTINLGS